jgi:oligosaccharide 4-alpha-D-glucosyltransferase
MNLRRSLFFSALFITNISFAQSLVGKWLVDAYTENIVKVTFSPNEYANNYNINNATILKPNTSLKSKYNIDSEGKLLLNSYDKKITISTCSNEYGWLGLAINLVPNEQIYGGGERALPLNRRGYAFNLYNNPWYHYGVGADNLNYSVPFFISNMGYGVFF